VNWSLAFGKDQTMKLCSSAQPRRPVARLTQLSTAVAGETSCLEIEGDYGDSEAADRIRAECALRRGESSELPSKNSPLATNLRVAP
jgi:hypothetical protein